MGPMEVTVANIKLADADSGTPVLFIAGYRKIVRGSNPPGRALLSESERVIDTKRYFPGPHITSDSGKYMDTASHASALITRGEATYIAAELPSVLSNTYCCGKPEDVCVEDTEGVCELVKVRV